MTKLLIAFVFFLLSTATMFSQELKQDFKKNTIKITPGYGGFNGLTFKLNYERNISKNLMLFGNYDTNTRYYKSAGLGIKYKIFTNEKFDAILGAELAYSRIGSNKGTYAQFDFAPVNKIEYKPSVELRYKFNKNLFLSLDWSTKVIGTGIKIYSNTGVGIGLKF
jgi:hypothetical protein